MTTATDLINVACILRPPDSVKNIVRPSILNKLSTTSKLIETHNTNIKQIKTHIKHLETHIKHLETHI